MLDIKSRIKEKGYTVTSLAQKMGITQVSLSRIINGNPTVDTLQKIATILDVDIKDLFVSTKGKETLYVEREGEFVPIGEIKVPKTETE